MKDVIKLTLCQQNCCPTVEFDHKRNLVVIQDDDAGRVTLTREQFNILLDHCRNKAGD